MKKSLIMACLAAAIVIGCGGPSGKTLASWPGGKITEDDLQDLLLINPGLGDRLFQEPTRSLAIDDLVNRKLLYDEAKKRGLDRGGPLEKKLEWVSKSLAIQGLIEQETNLRAHRYYEENKDQFKDRSFEDVKDELDMRFRREASQELAKQLRTKADVKLASKEPEAPPTAEIKIKDPYAAPAEEAPPPAKAN